MEPSMQTDPFLKINPFLKLNPFQKVTFKEPDRYHLFQQLIKNKDKQYLKLIQVILHRRLKEL